MDCSTDHGPPERGLCCFTAQKYAAAVSDRPDAQYGIRAVETRLSPAIGCGAQLNRDSRRRAPSLDDGYAGLLRILRHQVTKFQHAGRIQRKTQRAVQRNPGVRVGTTGHHDRLIAPYLELQPQHAVRATLRLVARCRGEYDLVRTLQSGRTGRGGQ